MISLYISSETCQIDASDVVAMFVRHGIACTVTVTHSSVPVPTYENGATSCNDGECENGKVDDDETAPLLPCCRYEAGAHIIVHDIDGKKFRDTVWPDLRDAYQLKCAFVRYNNDYMGCIRNWPGVFVESQCARTCETSCNAAASILPV